MDSLSVVAHKQRRGSGGSVGAGARRKSSSGLDIFGFGRSNKQQVEKKPKSATVEEPEVGLPENNRLVKGKSMPSLR